jgi:hypothetical protein
MSLRFMAATLSVATLLALGCDTNQFDSPDPDVTPARSDIQQQTQPPVTGREYISPDAALPRPESPRQPEYPVGQPPADSPATTPPAPADGTTTPPEPILEEEPARTGLPAARTDTDTSADIDNPAVQEVPADSPPPQN